MEVGNEEWKTHSLRRNRGRALFIGVEGARKVPIFVRRHFLASVFPKKDPEPLAFASTVERHVVGPDLSFQRSSQKL